MIEEIISSKREKSDGLLLCLQKNLMLKPVHTRTLRKLNSRFVARTQVPSVVTEASVEFKSLLEKRVEEMKTAVRESNDMAKATLASMGLPAALEAEDSGQTIPESTRARLSAIRMTSGGGVAGLLNKLGDADKMVQQAEASLGRVRKNLSEEASIDSRYRSKYGSRWTRSRSDAASKQLYGDLKMYVRTLCSTARRICFDEKHVQVRGKDERSENGKRSYTNTSAILHKCVENSE